MVTPDQPDDIARTLQTLVEQKSNHSRSMGSQISSRAWCLEFFFDLATNPQTRSLVHVSRLEVGSDLGGSQSRTDRPRLLLSCLGELRRR
jgi:hypothetical protein